MDYEKKYKEALERAREYWETDNDNTLDIKAKGTMEYLFPELKASDDERIRGAIIHFISHTPTVPKGIIGKKIMIAWLEKQGEEQPIIRWHSINEEPEEMKELFCEWESDDATWHDVAFYDKESHTFRHAKMPINVTKWIYVDELLEKQGEQKTAWSEDDEKMLVDAYVMLDWYKGNNWWTARRIKDWLNSLKERIGG